MTRELRQLLSVAPILVLLASTSTGFAQTGRTWVDPPPEGAAPPLSAAPSANPASPAAKPEKPRPLPASPDHSASTTAKPASLSGEAEQDSESARAQPSSTASEQKPAVKSQTRRKAVAEQKKRSASRKAAARNQRRDKVATHRGDPDVTGSVQSSRAERRSRDARIERIRRGIDSGLEVMNLRTIELPDGRRINILTRPDPEFMSEILAERY